MVYKRYSSPFEEKERQKCASPEVQKTETEYIKPQKPPEHNHKSPSTFGFLDNLSSDDIMIIALIIILLSEDKSKRDVPMILTLGFLFLIQYIDAD